MSGRYIAREFFVGGVVQGMSERFLVSTHIRLGDCENFYFLQFEAHAQIHSSIIFLYDYNKFPRILTLNSFLAIFKDLSTIWKMWLLHSNTAMQCFALLFQSIKGLGLNLLAEQRYTMQSIHVFHFLNAFPSGSLVLTVQRHPDPHIQLATMNCPQVYGSFLCFPYDRLPGEYPVSHLPCNPVR